MPMVQDLESLKYSELQKLAKKAGIKANQKIEKLLKAIRTHYEENEGNEEIASDVIDSTANLIEDEKAKSETQKKKRRTFELEEATLSVNVTPTIENKRRRRTFELEEATLSEGNTPTIDKNETKKPVTDLVKTPVKAEATTGVSKKRRRRTFELEESTLSAENTPTILEKTKKFTELTSPGASKNYDVEPVAKRSRKENVVSSSLTESPRKTRSSSSPGTKALIESMDTDCSSQERKNKLLKALDSKIKKISSPRVSQGKEKKLQASQIPRFMAYIVNSKTAGNNDSKSTTPGKDWKKIHNKEFEKFESIDDYLERKHQRMEKLNNSTKKPLPINSKTLTNSSKKTLANSSKKTMTNSSKKILTNSSKKTLTNSSNKILTNSSKKGPTNSSKKPKVQATNPSCIPKPAAFKPTVTSLKNMNLNFTKQPESSNVSQETPFKFTGNSTLKTTSNNSVNKNTSLSASKKAFDLKSSLSKPLSWKPYTGKLQPLDYNQRYTAPLAKPVPRLKTSNRVSAKSVRTNLGKESRPMQAKDVRRNAQLDRRNNQKYIEMMKKRGLM